MKWCYYFILILTISFTAILIYSPHFDYKYPFKIDEWSVIGRSIHYLDRGFQDDPNFTDISKTTTGSINYEIGAYFILSFLFLFINPIIHFQYLPAILGILTSIILFYFLYKRYSFWTGIFAILFFTSLKSNVNISGPWFFVPQIMAFPLFYSYIFLLRDQKYTKALISYILILLIHPLTSFFLYIPSIIFFGIKKNKKFLFIFTSIPILIFIIFTKQLWKGTITTTAIYFYKHFIFSFYPTEKFIKFFLPSFYGLVPFLLAITATIILFKKKEYFIPILILFSSILIFFNHIGDINIILPYNRLFYSTLLTLVPLSAIGLNFLIKFIRKKFENKLVRVFIPILIILLFFSVFINYYNQPLKLQPYKLINESDYDALLEFKHKWGIHNKVIVPDRLKEVLYPLTLNYPHHSRLIENKSVIGLYHNICISKNLIKNYDFIISEGKLMCEELKLNLLFTKNNFYFYKI